MSTPARPHVFISYAWERASNPGHNERVERLAVDLAVSCHVEFDQWSLSTGESTHAFMERMVNDPNITKVLVICDQHYAEKARHGRGGVGTETTIMTAEVYQQLQQRHRQTDAPPIKFIPVLFERNAAGEAMLPTMFSTAKYIDMSTEDLYHRNAEELLRAVWDRPRLEKPVPTELPAFIETPASALPTTSPTARALLAAIEQGQVLRAGDALGRYFTSVAEQWATTGPFKQPLSGDPAPLLDELARFKPLKDELQAVAERLARQRTLGDDIITQELERLFETATQRRQDDMKEPDSNIIYSSWTAGHIDFVIYETYLIMLHAFLKAQRWAVARALAVMQVYIRNEYGPSRDWLLRDRRPEEQLFDVINVTRHARLYSPIGHLLRERSEGRGFEALSEAESVLALLNLVQNSSRGVSGVTVPYWGRMSFELFERARTRASVQAGLSSVVGAASWEAITAVVQGWITSYPSAFRNLAFEYSVDLWRVWALDEQHRPRLP